MSLGKIQSHRNTVKQPVYLVVYRDGPKAQNLYFGPFVNERIASEFMDELPAPLPGGIKTTRLTQPYSHTEAEQVYDNIVKLRHN